MTVKQTEGTVSTKTLLTIVGLVIIVGGIWAAKLDKQTFERHEDREYKLMETVQEMGKGLARLEAKFGTLPASKK